MIYTLGIDVGYGKSPTGGALLWFPGGDPRLLETFEIRSLSDGEWQQRQYSILVQLNERLDKMLLSIPSYDLLLAFAHAWHGVNPQTALQLAELCGGVRGLAVAQGIACIGVQEAESKIALASSSRASKKDMIASAERIFGKRLSEHEADAVGHGLAGEAKWRRARVIREATVR